MGDTCVGCGSKVTRNDTVFAGFMSTDQSFKIAKNFVEEKENALLKKYLTEKRLVLVLDFDNTLAHCSTVPPPINSKHPNASPVYGTLSETILNSEKVYAVHFLEAMYSMKISSSQAKRLGLLLPEDYDLLPLYGPDIIFPENILLTDDNLELIKNDNSLRKRKFLRDVLEGATHALDVPSGGPDWILPPHYLKFRPGLYDFLDDLRSKFELWIYTQGTADYIETALARVDPLSIFFGGNTRVLSREHKTCASLCSKGGAKSLKMLFPSISHLCIVIDDRVDVWGNEEALLRCSDYTFLPHENSSMTGDDEEDIENQESLDTAALKMEDALKSNTSCDSSKRRRLLSSCDTTTTPSSVSQGMMNALSTRSKECDAQLPCFFRFLEKVHALFFFKLSLSPNHQKLNIDSQELDQSTNEASISVANCMIELMSPILRGVILTSTSYVNSLHKNASNTYPLFALAKRLGAIISDQLNPLQTTHLMVANMSLNTQKISQAHSINNDGTKRKIFIVGPNWLRRACFSLSHPDESLFPPKHGPVEPLPAALNGDLQCAVTSTFTVALSARPDISPTALSAMEGTTESFWILKGDKDSLAGNYELRDFEKERREEFEETEKQLEDELFDFLDD